MNKVILENAHINVDEALNRMMGNEALLERLLKKFCSENHYNTIEEAIETKDIQSAINASHALKGVAGNLSLTLVYELSSLQCDLFRKEEWDKGVALLPQIKDALYAVQEAINTAFDVK